MIYLVHGSDEAQVLTAAQQLYTKLTGADADEFAHDLIDGISDNAESAYQICTQTLQALQTLPFFGGSKVVWLKGANFLVDDRTGKAARTQEGIASLLECLQAGIGEDIHFIVSSTGMDKRRAFWKWISKNAEVQAYDRIDTSRDGWELKVIPLVKTEARSLGVDFDGEALDLFVALAGEDTRQIRSELEKLSLFLHPETTITVDAINQLVPRTHKAVIWEISRSIESRNLARAVELIDRQIEKGESAIGLIRASIIPTIRNLFYARLILDELPNIPTFGSGFESQLGRLPVALLMALPKKKDGNVNSWGLMQSAGKAKMWKSQKLRDALDHCLEADRSLVTAQLDHRVVLHRLMAKLGPA